MKQTIKIVVINILIVVTILFLFEIATFSLESYKYTKEAEKSGGFLSTKYIKYSTKVNDFIYQESRFRPIEKQGNRHSIILFSDSFTYGANLNEDQTFSHKLAKATNSTVYNRSSPGWGAQHILYQLKRKDFYSRIKSSDYIIYTFIDDHINRLNQRQWGCFWVNSVNLRYKEKNGNFTEIKPLFKNLWFLFAVKELQHLEEKNLNSSKNYEKNFDSFSLIMKESLKLAKKHYPNVKFVIMVYSPCSDSNPQTVKGFKKLADEGFIVLKTNDFTKENLGDPIYHFGEDCHPTEKAWDVIVPALVKELNL